MKDDISRLKNLKEKIEERLLRDLNCKILRDALREGDFISLFGTDNSILEYRIMERPVYVRIVWSEYHPQEKPFAFSEYTSVNYPEKPKTDFYTESYKSNTKYMSMEEIEKYILGV